MIKPAYYNEIDKYAAQWLRNLITLGVIAPGDVDERSIEDVHPDDLRQYRQCHFFAGIGVWSYALRRAGWADDRPIWTGSAPCQPFSAAGKGSAFDDERHLWPAFHWLIQERRPTRVVGEQVASHHIDPWIDLVQDDMEALGYAFAAIPFPSAGCGAPHIRDRTYWLADAAGKQSKRGVEFAGDEIRREGQRTRVARLGDAGRMDNTNIAGLERLGDGYQTEGGRLATIRPVATAGEFSRLADAGKRGDICKTEPTDHDGAQANRPANRTSRRGGALGRLADSDGGNAGAEWEQRSGQQRQQPQDGGIVRGVADALVQQRSNGQPGFSHEHDAGGRIEDTAAVAGFCSDMRPGPVNGFWRNADWILCRDAKWRPIEPGTFPLVDGAASRMGSRRADWHTPAGPEGFGHRANRLKGYGNAINAEAAIAFIKATM